MVAWGQEGVVHGSQVSGYSLEELRNTPVEGEVFSSSCKSRIRKFDCLRNVCRVCALWSALTLCPSMQVEQQNNGLDVDQDADIAYNSLKVSRLPSGRSQHRWLQETRS